MYEILKLLKTKNKAVFKTESLEELKAECERLDLREFSKPYIFTSVRCEDMNGKPYALTQSVKFKEGIFLPVSPNKIAELFNLK